MKTLSIIKSFVTEAIQGIASFTEKQVENLMYAAVRLQPDYTYVIPTQWVHSEQTAKGVAKKLFVVAYNSLGQMVEILTLPKSMFSVRHLGDATLGDLIIKAKRSVLTDGTKVWRQDETIEGNARETTGVWSNLEGGLPLKAEGLNVYLARAIAFTAKRHHSKVWVMIPVPTANPEVFDRKVKDGPDNCKILDLTLKSVYEFTEVELPSNYSSQAVWDEIGMGDVFIHE